jgi:PKD repeat protein
MKPRSTIQGLCLATASLLLSTLAFAQQTFIATTVDSRSSQSLRSHFSEYALFNINTAEIRNFAKAQKNKQVIFELQLPGLANWKFSIAEHDILSKNYSLTVNTAEGRKTYPRPETITYGGFLSDKPASRVSLTITDDIIYGIVKDGEKEYFIEPLHYLNKQASAGTFVVYEAKNVTYDPALTCGMIETIERGEKVQRLLSGLNCVQTQLAIASDESMFLRYGSAAAVQTHNIGVMNNVIWDYVNAQFTNNVEFVIVTQNVSTSAATDQLTPAYAGTYANIILENFAEWGENGNFGVSYDLGQLWTTRNIDNDGAGGGAGTIGLAYMRGVCGTVKYHLLEDFAGTIPTGSGSALRVLTSHEIGHNFGAFHDAGSGFIMSPSVGNTSTWSATSITSVDSMVAAIGCLSPCSTAGIPIVDFISTPEAICTGGSIQFTDHSLQGPTSWSWTLTGGSPVSSTDRNPSVTYATSGSKTVSLVSSNAGGSGTMATKSILVSNAGASACTNSGVSASEAGIRSFSLNTINRISGTANGDGNKYMDFSCSAITSLASNTLYNASAVVGFFSPTNPAPPHVFNHVLLYIDYNNDGDFLDANENVYSSGGSAFVGTHNFSFTTLATPPVTNQFLRARLIAADFGGPLTSCHNPSAGQVEDYSVYFTSGVLLPVSLISFDGYHHNGANILNWKTAEEKDHSHFEVERSVDGNSFEKIGVVNGSLNSNTISTYNFTDGLAGVSSIEKLYYRLRMVGVSGAAEFSKTIVIVTKSAKNGLIVSLQPNPFSNVMSATIQLNESNTLSTQLIDMTGRVIYTDQRNLPAGIHTVTYSKLESLAKGTYIIKLIAGSETVSRLVEKQ